MNFIFTGREFESAINEAIKSIRATPTADPLRSELHRRLADILESMKANAKEWELHTPTNREWIGSQFVNRLTSLSAASSDEIGVLFAMAIRFLCELDMNLKPSLELELQGAIQFAYTHIDDLGGDVADQLRFAFIGMPLQLLKAAHNSELVDNLKNIKEVSAHTNATIIGWTKESQLRIDAFDQALREREKRVSALQNSLKRYEHGFNFVGLNQGFHDLATGKSKELEKQQFWLKVFGVCVLLPLLGMVIFLSTKLGTMSIDDLQRFAISAAIPIASVTILFLYYFRVTLTNVTSIKSQLIQLELRKALCQFIQSYADYSHEIHLKNKDCLNKFENVIFSSIVASDSKIPATFDGIEQLAAAIKAVRNPT